MNKSKQLEQAETLKILVGTRRYFFTRGFRAATMDKLGAELGMSKIVILQAFSRQEGAVRDDISGEVFMTIYEMLTSGTLMGRLLTETHSTVAAIYQKTVSILLEGTLHR